MTQTVIKTLSKGFHNYFIDIYRLGLMLWIVLFHYTVQYNTLVQDKPFSFPLTFEKGGNIGVSLFFMVSGFFMTKSLMTPKYGLREYGKYVVRRYLRLWIPYAIACIIIYTWMCFLPIEGRTVNFCTLIANISCIIHPGFARVDNAHWFLADLLAIQLLLGFLLLIQKLKYRQIMINTVFAIVLLAQVFTPPILSGFSQEVFEVLLGVQLCLIGDHKNPMAIILSIIGFVVLFLSIELFIGALVFLVLVYLGKKYTYQLSDKYTRDFIQFAGSISFYWYLIHQNIGYSIMYYIIPRGSTNEFWLLVPVVITLMISIVVYTFDVKLNKLIYTKIGFLKK